MTKKTSAFQKDGACVQSCRHQDLRPGLLSAFMPWICSIMPIAERPLAMVEKEMCINTNQWRLVGSAKEIRQCTSSALLYCVVLL